MKTNLLLLPIIFFVALGSAAKAQIVSIRNVISCNAHDTLIDKTIWAYTVGEPIVTTANTSINIFTQGFHQPDRFSILPSIPIIENIVIYPNPAHTNSTLKFYLKTDKPLLVINIYDANGTLYQSQSLQSYAGETWHSLNPQLLASGMYFVKIIAGTETYAGKFIILN